MTRREARVSEKVVQAQIVTLMRSVGGSVYVLGTRRRRGDYAGTMQTPGLPDVFAILPRPVSGGAVTPVWIEVKAAGGRLRPEQATFRDGCRAAELAHVVGGVDEVIAFLVAGGWLKAENVPHYRQ